jgi:hypothetical protein
MKKRTVVFDAPCPDQQIDGPSHCDSPSAKRSEITGRRNGYRIARHRGYFKAP